MLSSLFTWLDIHPAIYWLGSLGMTAVLLGLTCSHLGRHPTGPVPRRMEWLFASALLLFLLAWRWPYLLCASEYNPDESQFIAGAMTLVHDPVFWRSVDGTTSGPLNFYALIPLHVLGLPFDYFAARLTGLLLCWAALVLLHRHFLAQRNPGPAALAVLSGAVFFAGATDPDFLQYSSELVPLALLALAIYWVNRRPLAAAFVAGLLPWAKLQTLLLAGVLLLWLLGAAWTRTGPVRWRRWIALVAAMAAPGVLIIGLVTAFGQFIHFFERYVLQNFLYVEEGMPYPEVWRLIWRQAAASQHFPVWGAGALLFSGIAAIAYATRRRRPSGFFWLGLALTFTAAISILLPARPSLHYVQLLVIPLILTAGTALNDLWTTGGIRSILGVSAAVAALLPLGWRASRGTPDMFGQFATHWRQPCTPLGCVLRYWREPGSRLTVWGWLNYAHVESGIPQGTRDVLTAWSGKDPSQREYSQVWYLADLQRNQPELFVDAVGPGSPIVDDRPQRGHESFPALADYVREHYRLVIDLSLARVYVRTDVLQRHPITRAKLRDLVRRGRAEFDPSKPPDQVSPATAPGAAIGLQAVQMIEPPAELTWHLAGMERSAAIDFGFHPRAYTEGNTDGADIIAELRMPGQPPLEIFHRRLEPLRQPHDRGPLSVQVDLPPYPPGTDFVIRSAAGSSRDTAWDWLYLKQVRFLRSPYYSIRQFPGFGRVPDEVSCAYPYLVNLAGGSRLMVPAPAGLTFLLDGSERRLTFSYGLAEGAYTGGGASDGATYRVELQRAGAAPRLLFARRLDPVHAAADRGPQSADLTLPAGLGPDDRIVLQIDPGAGDSWDWTYVSALELR